MLGAEIETWRAQESKNSKYVLSSFRCETHRKKRHCRNLTATGFADGATN